MVSLSSDESLKVPVSDMKKRMLLEKRELVNTVISNFYYDGEYNTDELNKIKSALISLLMEIGEHIKRFYGDEEYTKIRNMIYVKPTKTTLEEARDKLDNIIYDILDANREPLL